jgi:arylsulfatase
MHGLLENDFINVKNTSLEIIAEVETGDKPANGVIVAQGGRFGGWSLHVEDGTPVYTYNYVGIDVTDVKATAKLPKGKSTIKMDFAYDGGETPGAGGTVTLYVDGKSVGSGKIAATEAAIFSADESAGVGIDPETPVSDSYNRASSEFTGSIDKVTINLK